MDPSLLLAILCLGMASAAPILDPSLDTQWIEWKTKYGKSYSLDEEGRRRVIWEENMKMIEVHNEEERQGKHGYTMEMNAFGDMTIEDFHGTEFQPDTHNEQQMYPDLQIGELPPSVDWREKGYVTPVKDQGECNSCWAFGTTGTLEGQMFKKTGRLVSLSEQNLVDCSRPQRNAGCSGGRPDAAFQYVETNGGLASEESYPYEATDGACRYKPENSAANVTGYVTLPPNEQALMRAVAMVGPVAAAIHSSHSSFKFYKGGIYHHPNCSKALNHAVLVVGYGYEGEESENNKYWLVKNSYGKDWGMNGYVKMARDRNNQCGIASWTLYPVV